VTDAPNPREFIDRCKAAGERAYDAMYEARNDYDVGWQKELAVDAYRDAYRTAQEAGLEEEAAELMKRILHIKGVARQLRSS